MPQQPVTRCTRSSILYKRGDAWLRERQHSGVKLASKPSVLHLQTQTLSRRRLGPKPAGRTRATSDENSPDEEQLPEPDATFDAAISSVWQELEQLAAIATKTFTVRPTSTKPKLSLSYIWQNLTGVLLYKYYNWRQDNYSDLILLVALNSIAALTGASLRALVHPSDQEGPLGFWSELYEVLSVTVGQNFPEVLDSTRELQIFSVAVGLVGMATFALVLALVEQVVMDTLDANVKMGSKVYEHNHILLLGWCSSAQDVELIMKILQQLSAMHRNDGGATIVVLCQQDKLEMESTARRYVPEEERYGSRFVFRRGSPLIPESLRTVSAERASSIVVVGDSSRSGRESDAQVTRSAVLLDEMLRSCLGDGRGAHIVVEVKDPSTLPLLQLACSARVLPVPTWLVQATRLSFMVKHPLQGVVSSRVLNFTNRSAVYTERYPSLAGVPFGEAVFRMPNALLLGAFGDDGRLVINPPADMPVGADGSLLLLRRTAKGREAHQPLPFPIVPETPSQLHRRRRPKTVPRVAQFMQYAVPSEYLAFDQLPVRVLVCGWAEANYMALLLGAMDDGPSRLPHGSEVILANDHSWEATVGPLSEKLHVARLKISHVRVDVLNAEALSMAVDLSRVDCAIVLCDQHWLDANDNANDGVDSLDAPAFLRLDSLTLNVQLNMQAILKDKGLPAISVFGQKLSDRGDTRYEDHLRLPLGVGLHGVTVSSRLLAAATYEPSVLFPVVRHLARHLTIIDSGQYALPGEEVSFWQLMRRTQVKGDLLVGYVVLPATATDELFVMLNPGRDARAMPYVWNNGDMRTKLVIIRLVEEEVKEEELPPGFAGYFRSAPCLQEMWEDELGSSQDLEPSFASISGSLAYLSKWSAESMDVASQAGVAGEVELSRTAR